MNKILKAIREFLEEEKHQRENIRMLLVVLDWEIDDWLIGKFGKRTTTKNE